ncbi:MAG TPA: lanthionine synthetase LanC family protein, partial [Kofleriaceae bacterium]|nr:lanthionine synthetase LanC family protein [Kofleriaceae bacterium]
LATRLLAKTDALCELPPHGWQTGMAHGPAGAIVALETCGALGWCRITNRRRQRWIDALSRCAVAGTDGALLWPTIAGQRELGLQSWCAGTPGIALALLQCYRLTREPAYLEFARGALDGVKVLSNKMFFSKTLCCGNAGYRHIFIEAYRITGEPEWLEHAARKARYSPGARPRPRLGLHQGELGIAYLAERLAKPLGYPFPALGASSA